MRHIVRICMITGGNIGAVLGIVIALMLDFLASGVPGNSWYESVQHDITLFAGASLAAIPLVVYAGIVMVIVFITLMGALIGAFFGAFTGMVFNLILHED